MYKVVCLTATVYLPPLMQNNSPIGLLGRDVVCRFALLDACGVLFCCFFLFVLFIPSICDQAAFVYVYFSLSLAPAVPPFNHSA